LAGDTTVIYGNSIEFDQSFSGSIRGGGCRPAKEEGRYQAIEAANLTQTCSSCFRSYITDVSKDEQQQQRQ
jgi:hypothetical protein